MIDANSERYSRAVALRGNDLHHCRDTLIDEQHVLTAAHYISTRFSTVSIGSHLFDSGEKAKIKFLLCS
jgi:hypothetical protein